MVKVPVEQDMWNSLSESDREQINNIMRSTGLIGSEDSVAAGTEADIAGIKWPKIPNPLCRLGCNAAEAAAVAACAGLSGPAAPVCIAVAHTAGEICRSRC